MALKRWVSACAIAAVVAVGLHAPAPQAKAEDEFTTYAWRVTAPSQDGQPDYLLGTMHVPIPHGQVMPRNIIQYMVESNKFFTEANLDMATTEAVAKHAAIKDGKTLDQLLSKKAWWKLVRMGAREGVGPAELKVLKPWFLTLMLTPEATGNTPIMDEVLRKTAVDLEMDVHYLESVDEQLQALDAVANREDLDQLNQLIEDPTRPREEMAALIKAYRAGDVQAMEKIVFPAQQLADYPDMYKKIFFDRNERWMPKLTYHFERDAVFAAVGLGHLIGDRGLLKLFEAKGYEIEQIAPDDPAEKEIKNQLLR